MDKIYAKTLGRNPQNSASDGSDLELSAEGIPVRFSNLGNMSCVGHGANSRVFKIASAKPFALKVIPCGNSESSLLNAAHEIHIMEKLRGVDQAVQLVDYEGIDQTVQFLDDDSVGDDNKTVYILEEFLQPCAGSFPDGLHDPLAALDLIAGVCRALISCRNAGVYHFDIQPKNIFSREGTIVLGDFSASLLIEELPSNRKMRGTLAYMAPEVYRDGQCSEQSDIYSVGLILYCLFHRHVLPFMECDSQDAAVFKRLAGTAFPPIQYPDEELQFRLEQCVRKACSFYPEQRFSSFEQFLDCVEELREGVLTRKEMMRQINEQAHTDLSPLFFDADPVATSVAMPSMEFDADPLATTVMMSQEAPPAGTVDDITFLIQRKQASEALAYQRRKALAEALRAGTPSASQPPAPCPAPPLDAGPTQRTAAITVPAGKLAGGGVICESCGSIIRPGAKYCPACGAKVRSSVKHLDIRRVQFSAIAPRKIKKGEYAIIDILMYEDAFRSEVDSLIKNAEAPVVEKKSGMYEAEKGAQIRIRLSSPDIEVEDCEEVRQWSGDYVDFSFAVFVPDDFKKRQILFYAFIYKDDVILTKLTFCVKCFSLLEQKLTIEREDILSAFVSYASQDRNRVATIIQGMKKARPEMDIFFDVERLRSGEDWEKALRAEIERRDILYLCWSHFAKQSKWVDAEWRYALANKGIDGIEPIPIEAPENCPPPAELSKKHFNDKLLYFMNT